MKVVAQRATQRPRFAALCDFCAEHELRIELWPRRQGGLALLITDGSEGMTEVETRAEDLDEAADFALAELYCEGFEEA